MALRRIPQLHTLKNSCFPYLSVCDTNPLKTSISSTEVRYFGLTIGRLEVWIIGLFLGDILLDAVDKLFTPYRAVKESGDLFEGERTVLSLGFDDGEV